MLYATCRDAKFCVSNCRRYQYDTHETQNFASLQNNGLLVRSAVGVWYPLMQVTL